MRPPALQAGAALREPAGGALGQLRALTALRALANTLHLIHNTAEHSGALALVLVGLLCGCLEGLDERSALALGQRAREEAGKLKNL
jgi:hypothetical protein